MARAIISLIVRLPLSSIQMGHSAILPAPFATCDDGNGNIVFTKEIEHTDFPLDEITLYFTNNVIHLPSEY
ncbi:MAG: DUF6876 family protein [Candidatus Sulfotelmatobacter sp.]